MVTKEKIIEAISRITDPKIITGVVISGGKVGFALESKDENLRKECEKLVFAIPGVEKVTAVLTGVTGNIVVENKEAPVLNRRQPVAGVKKIIAVASGKGGVGKSTVTANLAAAMAESGLKVGIADADIYGPSMGKMFGIKEKPELDGALIRPIKSHNVQISSMGVLMDDENAAIWRGPMATKALHQLIRGIKWDIEGELDVLLLDLPPGTGDIQLSLAQHYPIDGVILVSTPQDVAVIDVKKAATMFTRVDIPILGVIENMAYFIDPLSGNKTHIFGEGGARKFAADIGAKFLGEVPINTAIRENADIGKPQVQLEFSQITSKLF